MSSDKNTAATSGDPLISFIVPTRNSFRTIEACVASIRAQRYPHVEVIVVDNHSKDGTWRYAEANADIAVTRGPERSAQRNYGASVSSGQLLVFIDSDMVLEGDVAREAAALFSSKPGLGTAVIPEVSFGEGFWARCRSLEKRLYLGDPAAEAARIFRRTAFEELHGYDEALTGPEDYELPDRMASAGWESARIGARVWHDEGRVKLAAVFLKKRYYGQTLSSYLFSPASSRSRGIGRTGVFSNRRVLLSEPVNAAGLLMLKLVDGAGLAIGMLQTRLNRRRGTS